MKLWIEKWWYLGGYILLSMVVAMVVVLAVPVSAAPMEDGPEIETCLQVAVAGGIKIYECESLDLFVNQLGFMTPN